MSPSQVIVTPLTVPSIQKALEHTSLNEVEAVVSAKALRQQCMWLLTRRGQYDWSEVSYRERSGTWSGEDAGGQNKCHVHREALPTLI